MSNELMPPGITQESIVSSRRASTFLRATSMANRQLGSENPKVHYVVLARSGTIYREPLTDRKVTIPPDHKAVKIVTASEEGRKLFWEKVKQISNPKLPAPKRRR